MNTGVESMRLDLSTPIMRWLRWVPIGIGSGWLATARPQRWITRVTRDQTRLSAWRGRPFIGLKDPLPIPEGPLYDALGHHSCLQRAQGLPRQADFSMSLKYGLPMSIQRQDRQFQASLVRGNIHEMVKLG